MPENDDHETIQQILAARALRTLDETEQDAADALVAGHLPTCAQCRAAYQDFETIAGELALGAPSMRPPITLDARVLRDPSRRRARRRTGAVAVSAVVLVALGTGLWSMHLTGRVSRAERQQAQTAELISAVAVPDSRVVQLAAAQRSDGTADVSAVYVPNRGHLYVFGNMTDPSSSDRVYQVWLGRSGLFASGGTFLPGPQGFVLVRVAAGGGAYDHVLITEESAEGSDHPSDRRVAESDL
jgi:hypothetical protein